MRAQSGTPVLPELPLTPILPASHQRLEISRSVDDPEDLYTSRNRQVQNDTSFEAFYSEQTQFPQTGVPDTGRPSHLRLTGEHDKRLMCGGQEAMPDVCTSSYRVVERLFIQIPVSAGSDDISTLLHPLSVFFKCSSNRRCFSSQ